MKFLIAFFISMIAALSVNAQHRYYLGTRGEIIEYDTAVVVHISAYKKDLQIVREQEAMIDSLSALNEQYLDEIQEAIIAKQKQEEAINNFITDLNESSPPRVKNKWYMNPILGMGVGLLIGVYLIK